MQIHARPPSRAVLISSSPARQPAGSDQISAAPLSVPHSPPRPADPPETYVQGGACRACGLSACMDASAAPAGSHQPSLVGA